mmetsp:Transcript_80699/g.260820  ORF Transcript_80699/g.260820 Transcript_80699/m.260820 type:complete len:89 (+) Transcript_80699:1875-2141(+)
MWRPSSSGFGGENLCNCLNLLDANIQTEGYSASGAVYTDIVLGRSCMSMGLRGAMGAEFEWMACVFCRLALMSNFSFKHNIVHGFVQR